MKAIDTDARQGSPRLHLLPDGPDKSGELARERNDDLLQRQTSVAAAVFPLKPTNVPTYML